MCKLKDELIEQAEKQYSYGQLKPTDNGYELENREQADYTDDKINDSQLNR